MLRPSHLVAGLFLWSAGAMAQELDLSITDPDEIAAVCGGDAVKGATFFGETCSACHAIDAEVAMTMAGPNLFGMFGRQAGSLEGFDFSASLVAAGVDGVIWEQAPLHQFLGGETTWSPEHPVVADQQEMFDILTYLRTATLPPPPAIGEVEVPAEVLAMDGDVAYGEYLASECAGCHNASAETIPMIEGLERVYFMTALFEYRARARTNDTMQSVAGRLGDEEIAALAAYFAE